jgi:ATPase subunit of ABC transporter with duplicated ATPase domains
VLSARAVSLQRGGRTVLSEVSVSVGPGARLGVVGPNGIGKSSLLSVLAGLTAPDSGAVERSPASLTVGLLHQEPDGIAGEDLLAYLARRTGVANASAELDRLTAALADDPGALESYTEALERFVALGGADFDARAEVVCREVGLPPERLGTELRSLSGGQAARARLAAVLLARFDVWLLDEPTNDLDFEGIDRLERFLAGVPGAVVTVSHDRAFLDRCVTRILEIEEHTHRGVEYAGAWSEYVQRRTLSRSQAGEAYDAWRRERERLRDRIRAQRAWSEHGVRKAARRPRDADKAQRDFRINRTEKQAAKVRTSERALARLGTLDKPWEGWELRLDLAPADRAGSVVARLDAATLRRGGFTLGPFSLQVDWADRIVVSGPNGAGKSTLLAALFGTLPLDGGSRWVGPSVRFGVLDQRRSSLDPQASVLDGFVAATGATVEEARSTLAKFGLTSEHVRRPQGGLSPGERTRAQLAVLTWRGANTLVLDEPTNHLDLPAIEQLEAALDAFSGTLIVVTHDRWLLETVSFTRAVEVGNGQVAVGSAAP